jgi:hypothetical protein
MARNCKVIATCFVGRVVRENTTVCGNPPGFFNHSQNFPNEESVLDLIKLNYDLECRTDPGVECDTIIVNNEVGWHKGDDFLASINNADTFSGKLKVINRKNCGRAFGGYNEVFEVFKDDYDYWIFTEDDILINGKEYFRICIDEFEAEPNIGFMAIQGLSSLGLYRKIILHAHGGVGITHINVLNRLYNELGSLPHCKENDAQDYASIIEKGEIAFTNLIFQLGYNLRTVKSKPPLYSYAYDYMRGISAEKG